MKIPYVMKKCNRCGEWLVANSYNFHRMKKGKYGLQYFCKPCKKHYPSKKNNKEKISQYNKEYYENNKEKIKQRRKECYENNKEYYKNKSKERCKNNKGRDKERHNLQNRKYKKTTKGRIAMLNSNSRKRFTIYIHDITIEMYNVMLEYFDGRCAYTGVLLNENNFSFEHIIPNSLDGYHAIYNIIPISSNINSSKSDKELLMWYLSKEFYSEERLERIFDWLEYAYNRWGK